MGIIICGTKTFSKQLGYAAENETCADCEKTYRKAIVRYKTFFCLVGIPLFPIKSAYLKMCPVCGNGIALNGKQAKAELAAANGKQPQSLDFFGKHILSSKLAFDKSYEFWVKDNLSGENFCVKSGLTADDIVNMKKERGIKAFTMEKPVHPTMGEVKYSGIDWKPIEKAEFKLWDKVYNIPIEFYAHKENDGITEEQETAFEKLKDIITKQQPEIEAAILAYARTDNAKELVDRFIPSHISFSRKGECALFVEDTSEDGVYNDETETSFGLFLLPKFYIEAAEDASAFLMGY